jgi:hypothetical protein
MMLLIVLLLLLSPAPARGDALHLGVRIDPDSVNALPDLPGLQAGIRRLLEVQFAGFPAIAFDDGPAAGQEAAARVDLGVSRGVLTVSTEFAQARATRSLLSTLPAGSPASLLATITGDLAFLYYSSRGFSTLPLSPPPALVASLSMDALGPLTGWNPEELEPVGLAASSGEIALCFPHRYLTLGPLFQVSASTIRDINGQGIKGEPMQLSGIIPGPRGRILLLSAKEEAIVIADPRLGTRVTVNAPGLSALPARLLGGGTVAALSGKLGEPGIRLHSLEAGTSRVVRILSSYTAAFDRDGEGNLWAWDAGERRVRILTAGGREVFSIRPLFSAAVMPLPQRLAVLDDGSFLLAGSGEVWKFQSSGIPVWRLSRIPGRPGESLPPVFDMAADPGSGAVTILDAQSGRLLAFSSSPAGASSELASLLGRLDTRKPAGLRDISAFTRNSGLGLLALQYAATDAERGAARAVMLREKAEGYAQFAAGLTRDLLYERADGAWLRTAETLRELAAEAPADQAAAAALPSALARRRDVRAALSGARDVQIVSVRVRAAPGDACGVTLTLEARLRNSGALALRGVRAHASLPALASTPSLAAVNEIPARGESVVTFEFGRVDGESPPSTVTPGFLLLSYERGRESVSTLLSFAATPSAEGPAGSLAEALSCRAGARDTLAASLPDFLLTGARTEPPEPLAELAGVLRALGAQRSRVRDERGNSGEREVREPIRETMRGMMRSLAADEAGWTVVGASIASSLGMSSAIVSIGDRSYAAVDTGVPFFSAFSWIPGLDPFRQTLGFLSPGGTLWLPLSGRVPPSGADAVSWAIADALAALQGQDLASASRFEVAVSAGPPGAPMPFPLVVPEIAPRRPLRAAQDALESALADVRVPERN